MNRNLSQMLAVSASPDTQYDPEALLRRAESAAAFQLLSSHSEDDLLCLEISSGGEVFHAEICPVEFQLPELYRCQHLFPDVDAEAIERAQIGLSVDMEFGADPLASYHLQLKLICSLVPELLAVTRRQLGKDSLRPLGHPGRPAPGSLPRPGIFTRPRPCPADDDCVWLHTHGLNRCGCPELEVLNSTKETYQSHYNVLETLANRLLDEEEIPGCGEPYLSGICGPRIFPWLSP